MPIAHAQYVWYSWHNEAVFTLQLRVDRAFYCSGSSPLPAAVEGSVVRNSAHHMAAFICTNFMWSLQNVHLIHSNVQPRDALRCCALPCNLAQCLHFRAALGCIAGWMGNIGNNCFLCILEFTNLLKCSKTSVTAVCVNAAWVYCDCRAPFCDDDSCAQAWEKRNCNLAIQNDPWVWTQKKDQVKMEALENSESKVCHNASISSAY